MKRVVLSITGTVFGLVALLSFKSHTPTLGNASALPGGTQSGPSSSTSTAPAGGQHTGSGGSRSSSAPKQPRSSAPAGSGAGPTQTKQYLGSAEQTQYGVVQVAVTVSGKKITNVRLAQLTAYDGTSQYINSQAAPILVQETMSAQSAQIDSVSGASYTSAGYIQSLQSALDKAGIR